MADRAIHDTVSLLPAPIPFPLPASRRVAVPTDFRHPLMPVEPATRPTLLPILGAEDDVPPSLEALLTPVAVRAQRGDHGARNALYAVFESKLRRFARRVPVPATRPGDHGIWERDDVYQESFVVFDAIIQAWRSDLPFGRYVLANFPWRLRDTVLRGIGRRPVPPRTIAVSFDAHEPLPDLRGPLAEAVAIVDAVSRELPPDLGEFLRLRFIERLTPMEAAHQMGISDRTASRYWRRIRSTLISELVS